MTRFLGSLRVAGMSSSIGSAAKIIGATVRATNRTYGLAPAREAGEPETVVEVVSSYDMTIRTAEGNVYANGDYTIVRYAEGL